MQQNALILQRRAPSITRLRPVVRLSRCVGFRPSNPLRYRFQRRWASNWTTGGTFLGTEDFAHLGGKHYFGARVPSELEKDDVDAWLQAVDTCLPVHLRRDVAGSVTEGSADLVTVRRDISLLLIEAQRQASLDILQHLGIALQRWDAVSWIVQTLAQPGSPPDIWSEFPSTTLSTGKEAGLSLDKFTSKETGLLIPQHHSRSIGMTLDQLTVASDPRFYDTRLQRGALGQIWQSLGGMIIQAAQDTGQTQKLMPHILSLLATLHHDGIVPESVYRELPDQDTGFVQQPPMLSLFSSRILTALSDAAWDARRDTTTKTEKSGLSKYSSWNFGLEPPGVRYQTSSQELRPEIWLELVLWSCLHGGWVQEGIAILEQISSSKDGNKRPWSLVCWRNNTESSEADQVSQPTFGWRDALDLLEGARPESQPRPSAEDKASVVRTVSSEVIAAFVDASISQIYTGVGQRGLSIRAVLDHVKQWKQMLSCQNLGLGFATWDTIVQRFIESGGIWLERDPDLAMEILQLVEPYGKEQEAANAPPPLFGDEYASSPYFMNASALPLNLLHRVLHTHAQAGNLDGTMATLKALQDFTELNQRRSIERFFRNLKVRPNKHQGGASQGLLFNTGLAAAEYPAFYPQIPMHVLAIFLGVAKEVRDREFYKWIFDSGTAIDPLIPDSMYKEASLAPALIRFASATDNQDVLEHVMMHHSQLNRETNALIPTPILTSLVETLIQRRKWPAVRNVLNSIVNEPSEKGFNAWDTRLIPIMIRELFRIESNGHRFAQVGPNELLMGMQMFSEMVEMCRNLPRRYSGLYESDILFCSVALLASVDKQWARFCSGLYIMPSRAIPLRINAGIFNIVLEGVLESRGLAGARKFWDTWCHTAEYLEMTALAEGGIFRVPRNRPQPQSASRTDMRYRILIESSNTPDIDIAGRIRPDLHGAWLLLRALRADRGKKHLAYDYGEMEVWVGRYFEALSKDKLTTGTDLAKLSEALGEPIV